jgi:hypothetical protein
MVDCFHFVIGTAFHPSARAIIREWGSLAGGKTKHFTLPRPKSIRNDLENTEGGVQLEFLTVDARGLFGIG